MGEDEGAASYDVPAHDETGQPVTVRLRPGSAAATIDLMDAEGATIARAAVSVTNTSRFASFIGACALSAQRRAIGELS